MNVAGNVAVGTPKIRRHTTTTPTWTARAACRGHDPNLWFREDRNGTYSEARIICAACPVRADCLDWAVETNTQHGLFGGLTPRERKPLRPRRRRPVVRHG